MREHFLVVVRRPLRAGGIARQARQCCRKGSPFNAALCHSMRLLCGAVLMRIKAWVHLWAHDLPPYGTRTKAQAAIKLIAACAY